MSHIATQKKIHADGDRSYRVHMLASLFLLDIPTMIAALVCYLFAMNSLQNIDCYIVHGEHSDP